MKNPSDGDIKACSVCGVDPPLEEVHGVHYGAVCCSSCKAFFRRIHQNKKKIEYKCKGGKENFLLF